MITSKQPLNLWCFLISSNIPLFVTHTWQNTEVVLIFIRRLLFTQWSAWLVPFGCLEDVLCWIERTSISCCTEVVRNRVDFTYLIESTWNRLCGTLLASCINHTWQWIWWVWLPCSSSAGAIIFTIVPILDSTILAFIRSDPDPSLAITSLALLAVCPFVLRKQDFLCLCKQNLLCFCQSFFWHVNKQYPTQQQPQISISLSMPCLAPHDLQFWVALSWRRLILDFFMSSVVLPSSNCQSLKPFMFMHPQLGMDVYLLIRESK